MKSAVKTLQLLLRMATERMPTVCKLHMTIVATFCDNSSSFGLECGVWQGDRICCRNASKGNEWDSEEQVAGRLRGMLYNRTVGFYFVAQCGISLNYRILL